MSKAQRYRSKFFPQDLGGVFRVSWQLQTINAPAHERAHGTKALVYTSKPTLDLVAGTPVTPPFAGQIVGVRGNVATAPSTGNLTFDVLLNTFSIFSGGLPTIYQTFKHGPIIYPRNTRWRLDDTLQVQMVAAAGATGPLVVHIMYLSEV